MKDKILTLIIGILIGAIIMTCIFVVYTKNNNENEVVNEPADNIPSEPSFPNNPENGDFQFQGVPQGGNGPRGNFNRNDNFSEEMPEGEPPAKPDSNQTVNTES